MKQTFQRLAAEKNKVDRTKQQKQAAAAKKRAGVEWKKTLEAAWKSGQADLAASILNGVSSSGNDVCQGCSVPIAYLNTVPEPPDATCSQHRERLDVQEPQQIQALCLLLCISYWLEETSPRALSSGEEEKQEEQRAIEQDKRKKIKQEKQRAKKQAMGQAKRSKQKRKTH